MMADTKAVVREMTKKQLQALVDEYVITLDDRHREEYFQTAREYARTELDGFIEWLEKRPAVVRAERFCADSEDGNHVLKQDGPFSVVYCDACGMNKGFRNDG